MTMDLEKILAVELTPVPGLLRSYISIYYNNFVSNSFTWLLVVWFVLHSLSNTVFNEICRNLRFKEYLRVRIKESLWNCLILSMFYTKFTNVTEESPIKSVLVLILITISFYLHWTIYDALFSKNTLQVGCNFMATLLLFILYNKKCYREITMLVVYMSITRISLEISRLGNILLSNYAVLKNTCFTLHLLVFSTVYFIMIPLNISYSLVDANTTSSYLILILLSLWILLELCNSVIIHWCYHLITKTKCESNDNIIECSLYDARSDDFFYLTQMRNEMYFRQEKALLMRRPKSKNTMVLQTLKCMVAIKRKLEEKRRNRDQSDLDEDTTTVDPDSPSDDSDLGVCNGKFQFNIQRKNDVPENVETHQEEEE